MTAELHKIIVRAALKLLAEKSDQEIGTIIGFPVSRKLINWCIANPHWKDPEITDALNAALAMIENLQERELAKHDAKS